MRKYIKSSNRVDMKQVNIHIGHSYLFKKTEIEHKRDMVGKVFKVINSKKGSMSKGGLWNESSCRPMRYRLDNGRWASACELSEI